MIKNFKDKLANLGFRLIFFSEIDSTNSEALRLLKKGAKDGLVIYADFQTKGRGRKGRVWLASPQSSLLLSLILEPKIPQNYWGLIPIITGLAGAMAIEKTIGFKPGLIWPNDIWGKYGKIGGVLVEGYFSEQRKALVSGIGINITQSKDDFPEEIQNRASSIFIETGKVIERDRLLFEFLSQFKSLRDILENQNYSKIVELYSNYDIIKGKEIRIYRQMNTITALSMGIDEFGKLKIKYEDKQEAISEGEIIMLRSR